MANALSAGVYPICPGTPGLFSCQIRLTEDGLRNYKEVVKVFFQYIALLKDTPPQEWIFDEQKGLADVDFKFKQKTPASRFTSKISAVMQTPLPREWLLSGHSRLRKFDSERISAGLDCLRADNFRMAISSQTFPGGWDSREKWYGTEYKYEKIPADFLEEIKKAASSKKGERLPELHLPHIVQTPAIAPKLIRNDDLVRTWFKKDDTFWVPKANLFIQCRNPLPMATAENSLKSKNVLNTPYLVIQWAWRLTFLDTTTNFPCFLEKVLYHHERDLEVKHDRFEIIKERLTRGLKNWDFQQPYNQVGDYMRWLSSEKGYINEQYMAELPHMHIETFVHGNLYKEDALKLANLTESILKPRALPQTQWPIARSLVFPPGANFVYHKTLKDPANVNHCIEYVLSIGDKAVRPQRAKTLLLDQMTQEPAFDQLRTKEQLGYVVFSGSSTTTTTIAYRFHHSKLEKLKNLDQESTRLWSHIDYEYYDFELVHHDAANVKALTKDDMIQFYDQFILPSSPLRSKLAIHLIAQGTSLPEGKPEEQSILAVNKDRKDAERWRSNYSQG
ncbi:hypothetical protein DID88_003609 [Monilinia fructigena]|uniref:Peptidase M16 middle/third domain-containing protein n=1 Tax=Monilinia fructigena TaxID=38457 RepID=A0A395ITD8_9HELO|nr:hypothetical protein DID88_003609 [Monilinia fructigena]